MANFKKNLFNHFGRGILLSFLFASFSHAESLTLTTYYPAPFGAYDTIRLIPRNAAPTCNNTVSGGLYIDSVTTSLQVCRDPGTGYAWTPLTGVWAQNGNNIYPTDTATNPNILVGIGNTTPQVRLDIRGGDFQWGNNSRLQANQGGSIELGGNGATAGIGIPYIDFHFGPRVAEDFNTRIINDANGQLSIVAPLIYSNGRLQILGNSATTWGGWNDSLRFTNGGNAAISFPAGGLMFGMHSNRNFYWADTSGGRYLLTLDGVNNILNATGEVRACGGGACSHLRYFSNNNNYLRGNTFFNGVLFDETNASYYVDPDQTSSFNVIQTGFIGTNGRSATTGYPPGWGGGVHTYDLYAEGSIRAEGGDICTATKCLNSAISGIFLEAPINLDANHNNSGLVAIGAADGRRICFLLRTIVTDVDEHNDVTGCYITASGGNWWLEAWASDHSHSRCTAQCIRW